MSSVREDAAVQESPAGRAGKDTDQAFGRRRAARLVEKFSGIIVLLALVVLFAIWVPETFLTSQTVRSLASSQAVVFVLAIALVLPLAAGVFDLSVAGMLGLAANLVLVLQQHGMSSALAIIVTILVGMAIGLVNGIVVNVLGVDSFIATLGMSSVLLAASYAITKGVQIVGGIPGHFVSIGQNTMVGIPLPLIYAIVLAAVVYYVTEYTTVGRYLYAVGGSKEASRLVGVRVDRLVLGSFISAAGIAALAGVILASQLGSGTPEIGPPYLLPAFSAVFLGSTQIASGGRVNVLGTFVAVLLLATGIKGLQLVGAPSYIGDLFNGLALIVAVALSRQARRAG
jgi:ribose transport system permease protein